MIDEYTYGCFKIQGKEFLGDVMIKNNKPHYWHDLEGRRVEVKHVAPLLKEMPELFVIGTGAGGLLEVNEDVREYVLQQGLRLGSSEGKPAQYVVKKNVEAVRIINEAIKKGKKVCALLAGGF